MSDVLLTGGDLEGSGARLLGSAEDRLAWGYSPGIPREGSLKTDPNEDALSWVERSGVLVAAVADSHWGRAASEAAVRAVHRAALEEGASPPPLRTLVRRAFEGVAAGEVVVAESSTALVLARIEGSRIELASMADCRAFRIHARGAEAAIDPDANWLGFQSAREGLEEIDAGLFLPWSESSYPAAKGELLLLCSDGLTEPIYGIPVLGEAEFGRLVDLGRPLLDSARILLDEALRTDRTHEEEPGRGGEDNVAFILLRPSP